VWVHLQFWTGDNYGPVEIGVQRFHYPGFCRRVGPACLSEHAYRDYAILFAVPRKRSPVRLTIDS